MYTTPALVLIESGHHKARNTQLFRYLNISSGHVAYLLDFGASFADERPALWRRHDETECDGRARPAAATFIELRAPLQL